MIKSCFTLIISLVPVQVFSYLHRGVPLSRRAVTIYIGYRSLHIFSFAASVMRGILVSCAALAFLAVGVWGQSSSGSGSGIFGTQTALRPQSITGLINLLRYQNQPCEGRNNQNGTCLGEQDCVDRKGTEVNRCANGFGVCCYGKIPYASMIGLSLISFQFQVYASCNVCTNCTPSPVTLLVACLPLLGFFI